MNDKINFQITKNNLIIDVELIKTNNKNSYIIPFKDYLQIKKGKYQSIETIKSYLEKDFMKYYNKMHKKGKEEIPLDTNEYYILFSKKYIIIYQNQKENYIFDFDKSILYLKSNYQFKDKTNLFKKLDMIFLDNFISNFNLKYEKILKLKNINIVPVSYKILKAKYGYCDITNKKIVITYKMAKLSQDLIEYLLFHEYSHFLEANHSKNFYNILQFFCPEHKKLSKILKTYIL